MKVSNSPPDLRAIAREALLEVLESWLGVGAVESAGENNRAVATTEPGVSVQLDGPRVSGSVCLWAPRRWADAALRDLLRLGREEALSEAELADFSGELANLVAGKVAAQLGRRGYSCVLSTPEATPAMGEAIPPSDRRNHGGYARSDWHCGDDLLTLTINVRWASA